MRDMYTPETETIEDLQRGSLRLIQPKNGFRYGTDSVLLADFASARAKGPAVDLCAGSGVVALLIAARVPEIDIDLIELQPSMADLARRNIALNGLERRLRVSAADIREAAKALGYEKYRLAVSNPPYFDAAVSPESESAKRNLERRDGACSPEALCKAAFSLLSNGGRFCAVYPAARLFALMRAMDGARIRPKRVRMVQSSAKAAPKLALVEGVKSGGEGLCWMPALLLNDEHGRPSEEYARIYGVSGDKDPS